MSSISGRQSEYDADGECWEGLTPPYSTVVADPPWRQPSGGPRTELWAPSWNATRPSSLPYSTLSIETIRELPVADLAAEHAHLYLWTTNHYLRASYAVAEAWGFKPSQVLTWCKPSRGTGPGGAFSTTTEFILFARRGSLTPLCRVDSTWWLWGRGAHSEKPAAFLDVVERVSPGPYVELFARAPRLGWDSWGHGYEIGAAS